MMDKKIHIYLGLLVVDLVEDKATADIIQQAEDLVGLGNGDHICWS